MASKLNLHEIHFARTDSTNDRVRAYAIEGAEEGLYVSADEQTKGKGRRGRKWESKPDESVATSLLLLPDIPVTKIPTITTIAAIAVARMVKEVAGVSPKIKWPNDVVIDGKKLCGILCESDPLPDGKWRVIVGIGINVHQKSFEGEIADKATSMDLIKPDDRHISRAEVIRQLWEHFADVYEVFMETADLSGLKEEYEAQLANKDCEVSIEEDGVVYRAIARGVDIDGALLVERGGEIRKVNTGEVSVRGIYGYV